jgi:hypothetical protein
MPPDGGAPEARSNGLAFEQEDLEDPIKYGVVAEVEGIRCRRSSRLFAACLMATSNTVL